MVAVRDERTRQVLLGSGVIVGATLAICGSLLGWRYVPGWVGEWVGMMLGIMTTPFFMEASFVILGLVLVVGLNSWRRKRAGDELVYLEEIDGPDAPADLPDHAKWAIYRDQPLPGENPSLRERAEGALAIGDHVQAAECFAAMEADELKCPEVLEMRMALAEACGRSELAADLAAELWRQRSK